MPATDNNFPLPGADLDPFAVVNAVIGLRQRMHELAEHAEHPVVKIHLLRLEACAAIEAVAFLRRRPAGIGDEDPRQQVFVAGHPQRHVEAIGQPACTADVIRMEVRDQHARKRSVANQGVEYEVPYLPTLIDVDAGVDHGPAVAVFEEPEIDM